jgi:hypothetical protein
MKFEIKFSFIQNNYKWIYTHISLRLLINLKNEQLKGNPYIIVIVSFYL